MLVFSPAIGFAGPYAEADDRRLLEVILISTGAYKVLEQIAMQFTKVFSFAKCGLRLVVLQQEHAKVIIAYVGRKAITHNAFKALTMVMIDNVGLQYFDQRKTILMAVGVDGHFYRNDIQLYRIAIARGVVPVRQCIEAIVDHA